MVANFSIFNNRKIIIANKHKKEQVIAPLLKKHFNMECFVPPNYNTDELGTFTGEIPRAENPVDVLRKKCLDAMNTYGYDIGIASEGSFGPHPHYYFLPGDDEMLILIDKKYDLELKVKLLSLDTNFRGKNISSYNELKSFAMDVKFPTHGLIFRDKQDSNNKIVKGIKDWYTLKDQYLYFAKNYSSVFVETDMRAMHNPTRMKVIRETMLKLIKLMNHQCPNCQIPGFDVKEVIHGLACSQCKLPTKSTHSYVYKCEQCNYKKTLEYPLGKINEDPRFCDYCNP